MIEKILAAIEKYRMPISGSHVLIGLSGGADSVALTLGLNELKDEMGFNISCAHVNHMLRGEEAMRDEEFCRTLCEKYSVMFHVKRIDVISIAKEKHISVEMAAREVRYDFFNELCIKCGYGLIATAHTALDNAETVIFNLVRGSGTAGLCGIPPVRGNIVRPLILADRKEIEAYLLMRNESHITDSSNLCDDFTRNKIRHEIVPRLTEINPSFIDSVSRMCENVSMDCDFIESWLVSNSNLKFEDGIIDILSFNPLHEAIKARILIKVFESCGGHDLRKAHIDSLIVLAYNNVTSSECHLPGGVKAKVQYSRMYFEKSESIAPRDYCTSIDVDGIDGKKIKSGRFTITFEVRNGNVVDVNKNLMTGQFDCDTIGGKILIRNRKIGDKYSPIGLIGSKTIKKMMIDEKIPAESRKELPVFEAGDDIIWTAGLNICENYKVKISTKRILQITVGEC